MICIIKLNVYVISGLIQSVVSYRLLVNTDSSQTRVPSLIGFLFLQSFSVASAFPTPFKHYHHGFIFAIDMRKVKV